MVVGHLFVLRCSTKSSTELSSSSAAASVVVPNGAGCGGVVT